MLRNRVIWLVSIGFCVGGWLLYRRYDGGESPFAIFDMRAGVAFSALDATAKGQLHRGFTCEPAGGGSRVCRIITDGPEGAVQVLVDGGGRIAVLRFLVRDTSLKMLEEAHRITARWKQIGTGLVDRSDPSSVTQWPTADGRWLAESHLADGHAIPAAFAVTDLRRLGRLATSSPLTVWDAARTGSVDDAVLERLPERAQSAVARMLDSLDRVARDNARKALAFPDCEGLPAVAYEGTGATRIELAENALRIEQAVARIFPGSHLAFGDQEIFVVSPNGSAEVVRVSPGGSDADRSRFAFVLTFPNRLRKARELLAAMDADPACRSGAELIVAMLDTTGAVVGASHVEVDDEAMTTEVGSVSFVFAGPATSNAQSGILVEYSGSYGDGRWLGQVQWRELILADSMSIITRAPIAWAHKDRRGHTRDGALVNMDGGKESLDWNLPRGATASALSLESSDAYPRTRRLRIPPGANGLLSGWVLLGRI